MKTNWKFKGVFINFWILLKLSTKLFLLSLTHLVLNFALLTCVPMNDFLTCLMFIYLSLYLSINLSIYLSIYLKMAGGNYLYLCLGPAYSNTLVRLSMIYDLVTLVSVIRNYWSEKKLARIKMKKYKVTEKETERDIERLRSREIETKK